MGVFIEIFGIEKDVLDKEVYPNPYEEKPIAEIMCEDKLAVEMVSDLGLGKNRGIETRHPNFALEKDMFPVKVRDFERLMNWIEDYSVVFWRCDRKDNAENLDGMHVFVRISK